MGGGGGGGRSGKGRHGERERDRETEVNKKLMWEAVKERCDHTKKLDQNHIRAFPNVRVRLKEGVSTTSAGTCHNIAGLHSFEQLKAELN